MARICARPNPALNDAPCGRQRPLFGVAVAEWLHQPGAKGIACGRIVRINRSQQFERET